MRKLKNSEVIFKNTSKYKFWPQKFEITLFGLLIQAMEREC